MSALFASVLSAMLPALSTEGDPSLAIRYDGMAIAAHIEASSADFVGVAIQT